jgi:peptidoglycan LD-endopeptidase CwlK
MPTLQTIQLGSRGSTVRLLQMNLNGLALNYNDFTINGLFDVKTEDVLKNFQDRFEVQSTGVVNAVTWKLLTSNVRAIQRLLKSKGYQNWDPDGTYGQSTINAVRRFQSDNGLTQSGIVDPRTQQKLFNPHPKDNFDTRSTSTNLSSLNPYVASLARKFLALTKENGLDVRITTAFRSWTESNRLYAQGRTAPGQT